MMSERKEEIKHTPCVFCKDAALLNSNDAGYGTCCNAKKVVDNLIKENEKNREMIRKLTDYVQCVCRTPESPDEWCILCQAKEVLK